MPLTGYPDRARALLLVYMLSQAAFWLALAPRLTAQAGRAFARPVTDAPARSARAAGLRTSPATPIAGATAGAEGGSTVAAIDAATADVLRGLGARASVVFAGRVLEINRNDAAGYVDIVFRVEEPVRGCRRGTNYVLREWAGLWIESEARYAAGQRLLMLLPARGPSGMSAPVGGAAGAIPLLATRQPPLLHGAARAPASSSAEGIDTAADLRWVETLVKRQVSSTGKAEIRGDEAVDEDTFGGRGWSGPAGPLPGLSKLPVTAPLSKLKLRLADAPAGPDLQAVLSLLKQASVVEPPPGVSLAP